MVLRWDIHCSIHYRVKTAVTHRYQPLLITKKIHQAFTYSIRLCYISFIIMSCHSEHVNIWESELCTKMLADGAELDDDGGGTSLQDCKVRIKLPLVYIFKSSKRGNKKYKWEMRHRDTINETTVTGEPGTVQFLWERVKWLSVLGI